MSLNLHEWALAAAFIGPSIATFGLFIRLGKIIKTVENVEINAKSIAASIHQLSLVVIELKSWRDANFHSQEDLLERVRRLEDIGFSKK